jgi:hypothetical protein
MSIVCTKTIKDPFEDNNDVMNELSTHIALNWCRLDFSDLIKFVVTLL